MFDLLLMSWLLKVAFLRVIASPNATKARRVIQVQVLEFLFQHFLGAFQASRDIFLLDIYVIVNLGGPRSQGRRAEWGYALIAKHFQSQLGRWPSEKDLMLNGNPCKRKVLLSNDNELAILWIRRVMDVQERL